MEVPTPDISTLAGMEPPVFAIKVDAKMELADAERDPDAFEQTYVAYARSALEGWSAEDGVDDKAILLFNLAVRLWVMGFVLGRAIESATEIGDLFKEAADLSSDRRLVAEATYNHGICLMQATTGPPDDPVLEEIARVFGHAADALTEQSDGELCAYARANAGFALGQKAARTQGAVGADVFRAAWDAFGAAAEEAAACGIHAFAGKCLVNRSVYLLSWSKRMSIEEPWSTESWGEAVQSLQGASDAYVRAWDRRGLAEAKDRLADLLVVEAIKTKNGDLLRQAEHVSRDAEEALRAVDLEERGRRAAERTRNAMIIRVIEEVDEAEAAQLDKRAGSVAPESGIEEGAGSIVHASAAGQSDTAPRESFAQAVSAAQVAVDLVARDLEARIMEAQRFLPTRPEDREALIEDVAAALSLGLVVKVGGREVSRLGLQRGRTLTWSLTRGGYIGFKNHPTTVERPRPAGGGKGPQSTKSTELHL